MYTSGTAAEPKGALLSHEALIRFADGTKQTRFFLTPEDRIWTALPMFHIGGVAFSVATIYAGATLVHTGFFRPELALQQIASMRCTIVLAAFETIWLPVVNQPDFNDRDLSSVRIRGHHGPGRAGHLRQPTQGHAQGRRRERVGRRG
jgi:fatty-acyl-CoA synthase